jgi:hypothetical protein
MSEPEWTLGRVAYEAYYEYSGGYSLVGGDELPRWDEQSSELQRAWTHVGETIVRRLNEWKLPGRNEL